MHPTCFELSFEKTDILSDIKWLEAEIAVLSTIYEYENRGESIIVANMIEGQIDLNSYSIGKKCQKLASEGFINRHGRNPYSYTLTNQSKSILEEAGLVNKSFIGKQESLN